VPVPFSYVQFNAMLLCLFTLLTPVAIGAFTPSPVLATIVSGIVVGGFTAMFMVANELEDPFGGDANDLPMIGYHEHFVHALTHMLTTSWTERDDWVTRDALGMAITRRAAASAADAQYEVGPTVTPNPAKSRQAEGDLRREIGASQQHWGCMRGHEDACATSSSHPSADANVRTEWRLGVKARQTLGLAAGPVEEDGLTSAEPLRHPRPAAQQSDSSTKRSTSWQRVSGGRQRRSPGTAPVVPLVADAEEALLSS